MKVRHSLHLRPPYGLGYCVTDPYLSPYLFSYQSILAYETHTVLQADHAAPCHEHNANTLKTVHPISHHNTMEGMTLTNVMMLSCNITFLCLRGYQY